jgi:hypothetical protein
MWAFPPVARNPKDIHVPTCRHLRFIPGHHIQLLLGRLACSLLVSVCCGLPRATHMQDISVSDSRRAPHAPKPNLAYAHGKQLPFSAPAYSCRLLAHRGIGLAVVHRDYRSARTPRCRRKRTGFWVGCRSQRISFKALSLQFPFADGGSSTRRRGNSQQTMQAAWVHPYSSPCI